MITQLRLALWRIRCITIIWRNWHVGFWQRVTREESRLLRVQETGTIQGSSLHSRRRTSPADTKHHSSWGGISVDTQQEQGPGIRSDLNTDEQCVQKQFQSALIRRS